MNSIQYHFSKSRAGLDSGPDWRCEKESSAIRKFPSLGVRRLSLGALAIILSLFVASCAPTNFELTTATTPVCTAEDLTEWSRVVNQSQGVRGLDPVGFFIADFPAERFGSFNINNWHPLSGYKETLCGELHHFNVYDGSGAEMDWNHFMIPAPDFQFLITDALPYKGGSGTYCLNDDWHSCRGDNDCMEGELTPDQTFFENPWFPKSTGDSVLEGRQICMYGPWVRECVHGHRPEIHPAELIWWKEQAGSGDLYWLMALQDDSNRFDDKDQFDIEGALPSEWRPWSAAPMTARFQLAFEVSPAGPVLNFNMGAVFAHNVVTQLDSKARSDADNGAQHAIEYNGEIVLKANENKQEDSDLGVTFTDVCRRTDGTLQGYVTLTTKTGVDNRGKEGYHILLVFVTVKEREEETHPWVLPELNAKAIIITKGDPASMRPEEADGRLQLEGDFQVEVVGLKGATRRDTTVERVELVTPYARRELPYEPNPRGTGGLVKGLSLLDSAQLAFLMQSGTRLEVFWPGLTVGALIEETTLASAEAPPAAWRAMVKAAGGLPAEPAPTLKVVRAGQVQLRAVPQYAMRKEGRVSFEEGSPFVEGLNEVLARGNESETRKLFGTSEPLGVQWSIQATNLTSGESVSVKMGPAAPASEAVYVVEVPGRLPGEAVQISFPREPADAVFEVRATARVTDAFGATHEVKRQVWSHFLSDGTREGMAKTLLPAVAAAAGVPADKLLAAALLGILPPDDPRLRDPQIRRARMVHNFAMQAADDRRISLDELASLIRGAKLLGIQ